MLQLIIASIAGYIAGSIFRGMFFQKNNGTGWPLALVFALAGWFMAAIGLSIYAEIYLGASRPPLWVGGTALFFSGGIFYGIKRHKKETQE